MPITLDCPRCRQPLSIPTKKVGSYVNCPRCNGRFWVPEDAPKDSRRTSVGTLGDDSTSHVSIPSAMATPPLAVPPATPVPASRPWFVAPPASSATPGEGGPPLRQTAGDTPFDRPAPAASSGPSQGPAQPAASSGPEAGKRVARFISAEAPAATIQLAEDGKLPELHLEEGQEMEAKKPGAGMSPVVLGAVLCASVALSLGLVFLDTDPQGMSASEEKQRAWYEIEEKYFFSLDSNSPLQPYQQLLREARQAMTRGDRKTEYDRYRKVLDLLRAERGRFERGLTGSRSRDADLEKQIKILMHRD